LKLSIWPGLALAGGVLIAAVVALLLLHGGGGGPGQGRLPGGGNEPGITRLFPAETATKAPPKRRARGVGTAPGGSAAAFQYEAGGTGGLVLGGP
jgi:hypothetical protein